MQNSAPVKWIRRGTLVALATTTLILTGCGGGGGGTATSADAGQSGSSGTSGPAPGNPFQPGTPTQPVDPGDPGTSGNKPPTISAKPLTAVSVGVPYDFSPAAEDPDGDTLAFSIENRPTWASFNTVTGQLSGTPLDAGTSKDIRISVSDGKTSVTLPAFSITVAALNAEPVASGDGVQLSWDVPTQTIDGEPLSDLAGYRIHYGKSASALSETIELPSAGSNTFVVQNLKPGTYYFAVCAVTSSGTHSDLSNIVSRVIG